MKSFIAIVLLLVTGLTINYYYGVTEQPDISTVNFTLIDGRQINMRQLQGRPVLVTFWATSCAACIREIPDLIALHKKYSASGLQIIAVAMPYDRPDHVLEMSKARRLPYPVALDIDATIVRAFGNVHITPHNFLIAPDGKIIKQHVGILDVAATERLLRSM